MAPGGAPCLGPGAGFALQLHLLSVEFFVLPFNETLVFHLLRTSQRPFFMYKTKFELCVCSVLIGKLILILMQILIAFIPV